MTYSFKMRREADGLIEYHVHEHGAAMATLVYDSRDDRIHEIRLPGHDRDIETAIRLAFRDSLAGAR